MQRENWSKICLKNFQKEAEMMRVWNDKKLGKKSKRFSKSFMTKQRAAELQACHLQAEENFEDLNLRFSSFQEHSTISEPLNADW